MSKSNTFEEDLLKLIFNGTPITGIADNAASAPLTNLFLSLHTQDPGESGVQTTNEVSYPNYARVPVVRTNAGWTVTGNTVRPAVAVEFAESPSAAGTVTHAAIGTASSGGGKILYRGAITPAIVIAEGTQPRLRTTSTITEE